MNRRVPGGWILAGLAVAAAIWWHRHPAGPDRLVARAAGLIRHSHGSTAAVLAPRQAAFLATYWPAIALGLAVLLWAGIRVAVQRRRRRW